MAEAFGKKYSKEGIIISSAGIKPANNVHSMVILAMKEKGLDISKNSPKLLTSEIINDVDLIVTMGCGAREICVTQFSKPTIDWQLEDPKGKPIGKVREIRNKIELKVKKLLQEQVSN